MKMNKFVTVFFAAVLALSFAGCKKNQNSKTESEAETESEALEAARRMQDYDFDWSDFDDEQVVDDDIDF